MQTKEINYEGKRLCYQMAGEGPLVVLLHGFGETGLVWKAQFDIFPANKLVIPDLPGSGESEAIEDMSMEGLADAVKAIIDAESHPLTPALGEGNEDSNNGRVVTPTNPKEHNEINDFDSPAQGGGWGVAIIGHSMGGYIALAFAEKYSESLAGLGLFQSTAFADSEEKKELRKKGIRFIDENGAFAFLKTATPALYAPKTREEHPELIEEHLAEIRNFSDASLVSYYRAMMQRPDRTAVLKESKVPMLFVMGRHDSAAPIKDGLAQCHLPQIVYIHVLEGSGHMGMIEEPTEANQILSQFVNDTQKIV